MRERLKYLAGFVGGLVFGVAVAWATNPMGLTIPVPGQTSGPDYAVQISDDLGLIATHTHVSGQGNPVPTAGLDINADLTFNGYSATDVESVQFDPQGSPLTPAGEVYEAGDGGDLFYNDGSGNQIQITANGALNASSIGGFTNLAGTSGEALYTNGTGTFSYTSNTATSASVTSGPVTIRDVTPGVTKGVTLKSPTSLASAYSLTLPAALPASADAGVALEPVIMAVGSDGVVHDSFNPSGSDGFVETGVVYAQNFRLVPTVNTVSPSISLSATGVGSSYTLTLPTAVPGSEAPLFMGTSGALDTTGAQAIVSSMLGLGSVGVTQAASVNKATSTNSSGSFSTTSATFVNVSHNADGTSFVVASLTTQASSGHPVLIVVQPDPAAAAFGGISMGTGTGEYRVHITSSNPTIDTNWTGIGTSSMTGSSVIWTPAGAATYTLQLQALGNSGATINITNMQIVAYEIK